MIYSVIVPCYNEGENILEFYKVFKNDLKSILDHIELIFINDGSSDNTQEKLNELVNKNEIKIKTIEFSRNFGKEAAIKAGLDSCTGDYISIIDADLQQNPKYILDMIEILKNNENFDSVACYQQERKEGKILSLFKSAFYKLINNMSDIELHHSASDFRTFRKCVKDAILSMPENCRFSKGIFSWVGFNTYYMPYGVEKRFKGNSKWSFTKLFKYAIDGITAFSTTPLVFSFFLGLIIVLLCLLVIIIKAIFEKACISGIFIISSLVLFSLGIQLMFLGVLGQYISKTYIETKQRPMYIIRKVNETSNKTGNQ